MFPVKNSLGSETAAVAGANFFNNIVSENYMSKRHLIVHEVMGRNSGWLTAYSAYLYMKDLNTKTFITDIGLNKNKANSTLRIGIGKKNTEKEIRYCALKISKILSNFN